MTTWMKWTIAVAALLLPVLVNIEVRVEPLPERAVCEKSQD